MFKKVAIIGPGLIGGSMGLAMRRRKLAGTVVGIGRRPSSLDLALQVGAIESATLDMEKGLDGADLAVLATPTGAFEHLASLIARFLPPGALLTDVASSKVRPMAAVVQALAARTDIAYVSAHPMAGSEQSGPLAAAEDLFEGCICILTPADGAPAAAADSVQALWQALGARVIRMQPREHDRLVARISHVPHLAAAALMTIVDEETMHYCGGGLRDTTRIAASNTDMWLDIYTSNRNEIQEALAEYAAALQRMSRALETDAIEELRRQLADARDQRRRLARRLTERRG